MSHHANKATRSGHRLLCDNAGKLGLYQPVHDDCQSAGAALWRTLFETLFCQSTANNTGTTLLPSKCLKQPAEWRAPRFIRPSGLCEKHDVIAVSSREDRATTAGNAKPAEFFKGITMRKPRHRGARSNATIRPSVCLYHAPSSKVVHFMAMVNIEH